MVKVGAGSGCWFDPCILKGPDSKVVESAIDLQISKKFYDKKAGCLSAYRKMHNTQSVLVKAIEDWKFALDKKANIVGPL